MPHVRTDFPMERVHRIGEFKPNKIRPIVAKFLNYKHKEEVKSAGITKLSNSRFSVGDQFPKPVQEKRRALLPVKKAALKKGDTAVFAYDKLYINGVLYKPSVNKDTQKAGNNRSPGQLTGLQLRAITGSLGVISANHHGARDRKLRRQEAQDRKLHRFQR